MNIAVVSLNSCIDRVLECPGFTVGGHARARLLAEEPAGKGMNVARILARLGVEAGLFGCVGADADAKFAHAAAIAGVEYHLRAVTGRTRVNTTILDPERGTDTHLREQGEKTPPALLEDLRRELVEKTPAGAWICFCGSLPPGVDSQRFGGLVATLAGKGLRVAVDTSGPALLAGFEAGAALIKPNREELAQLTGNGLVERKGVALAARTLLERYPDRQLVILASDGERGAYLARRGQILYGRCAAPVRVVSTVGAGDALLAGYLADTVAGAEDTACLRSAVRIAAASLGCRRAGELPRPLPKPEIEVVALSC